MKTRKSDADTVLYIILCIITIGIAWALRIVISMAIRSAFEIEAKK